MRELAAALLFAVFCWTTTAAAAERITIEARVDDGSWAAVSAVEAVRSQSVSLRVKPVPHAEIRWFQIVPDIDIRYNNAVWPWLPNAYQWKGFDEIQYERVGRTV